MKPTNRWLPLAILSAALIMWGAMFALGTYLDIGADNPRHDIRKPLIIFGGMLLFLAFWGAALWLRSGRGPGKHS